MPLEKEGYRDNIERIKEKFPTKEILRPGEVADFLGVSKRTVYRMFSFTATGYISVACLARQMCS